MLEKIKLFFEDPSFKKLSILFLLGSFFIVASTFSGASMLAKGEPSTPTSLTVGTVSSASVDLSWSLPKGSIAATDYIIQYQVNKAKTWTTFVDGVNANKSTTITGLISGTAYNFQVAAKNKSGTSSYTSAVSATTLAAAPDAPTSLTVGAITSSSIALSWTAPAANGAAITDYIIQSQPSGGSWVTFSDGTSTTASTTVTGLIGNTAYNFRVAAVNSVGTGSNSSTASGTTSALVPDAPTGLIIGDKTDTTTVLSWTAPANNGSAITGYTIQTSLDNSTWSTFGTSAIASTTVTGLSKGTLYYFKVLATNSIGSCSYSTTVSGTSYHFSENYEFSETQDFDSGTMFNDGMIFPEGQSFANTTQTFGANQNFGPRTEFAENQRFDATQTFGEKAKFKRGTTFNASQIFGEKADFSGGISTFAVAQTFGKSAKFSTGQDLSDLDHDFSALSIKYGSGMKFRDNEVMGQGADFSSGVQDFGGNMTFDDFTIFSDSQVFAKEMVFDKYSHFGDTTDFSAMKQDFKEAASFGLGTTFLDDGTQTLSANMIPAYGVLLEGITCTTSDCKPSDASKYLAPGDKLLPGQDPVATFTSIGEENKSFEIKGLGITMSFGTVSGDGTFKTDLYAPENIPSSTNNNDGTVNMTTSDGASVKTVGSVVNLEAGTATVSGTTTITLPYQEDNLGGLSESSLYVLHYVDNAWKKETDCTINTTDNSITCNVSELSPFGIGGDDGSGSSGGGGIAMYLLNPIETPEYGFQTYVNGESDLVGAREVTLSFNVGEDITKVAISNKEDMSDASIQPYQEEIAWDLCSESDGLIKEAECPEGQYSVFVKFYNDYGNSSGIIMSNTVLDRGAVGSELTEDTITNIIQYFDNLLKYFTHNDKNYYIISDGLLTERNFFSEEYEEEITLTEEEIEEEIIADLETEEERVVYKFNRYLYHGSEGQEVKNLQSLLKDLGYFIFHKITGYYGLITTKAVSEFQRDNDLPGVGVVGPLTRKLLEEVQK